MISINLKRFIWVLVAGVAGGFGSLIHLACFSAPVSASSEQAIRSSRFELVNPRGKVTAVLDSDSGGAARLRFFGEEGATNVEIKDYAVRINGPDNKPRIQLIVGPGGKPILEMGDEASQQRIRMGVIQPDHFPSGIPDAWALLFTNPIDRKVLVSLGMITEPQKVAAGSFSVIGRDGKRWTAIPDTLSEQ
jgi:hypothetical protein